MLYHAGQWTTNYYCIIISERKRETRREASRRSTQRASCYSHMGKQNNIINHEILILAIWFMEQKVIIFWCRTDIHDEPAWPEPARSWRSLTAYFSNLLKFTSFKFSHNKVTSLKIVVSNFYRTYSAIKKELRRITSMYYPQIDLKLVFSKNFSVKSFFCFKDKIPDDLQSNGVYFYNCGQCQATYVGETSMSLTYSYLWSQGRIRTNM